MAASEGIRPGIDGFIYKNTGTYGTPTWTSLNDLIRDVQVSKPWDLVAADVRATRVKLYHPTQIDFQVQVVVRKDDANTAYTDFLDLSNNAGVLDMLVLDGPLTREGATGLRAHFHASDTGQDQSIGAVQYTTFELKPGFSADGTPKYVTVGASSAHTDTDPGS